MQWPANKALMDERYVGRGTQTLVAIGNCVFKIITKVGLQIKVDEKENKPAMRLVRRTMCSEGSEVTAFHECIHITGCI